MDRHVAMHSDLLDIHSAHGDSISFFIALNDDVDRTAVFLNLSIT